MIFNKNNIFKMCSKISNYIQANFYFKSLFCVSLQAYSYLNLIQIR